METLKFDRKSVAVALVFISTVSAVFAHETEVSDVPYVHTQIGEVTVNPTKDQPGMEFDVDGKTLFSFYEDSAGIISAYPSAKNASLILLQVSSGSWCGGYFQILDISASGETKLTPEFGECTTLIDPVKANVSASVVYKNGSWNIGVIPYHGPYDEIPQEKVHWYIYRDGVVTLNGKLAPDRGPASNGEWGTALKMLVFSATERESLIKKYGSEKAAYEALRKAQEKRVEKIRN